MQPPVPPDALERARAVLQKLEEQLKPLFERLPDGPESAVQFRLPEAP